MAKINPLFILIGVLVVAFVGLLLSSGSNYLPYDSKASNYAKYEAMTANIPEQVKSDESAVDSKSSNKVAPSPSKGFISDILQSVKSTEAFEPNLDEPQSDEPKSVKYAPFRDSTIIDLFSQVTKTGVDGVDGCVSSGLSNADGQICLTPELIKLLKNRGGNASGN